MQTELSELQNILCDLCAGVLFDKKTSLPKTFDIDGLLTEAKHQTVFPTVCAALKEHSIKCEQAEKQFYYYVTKNVRVNYNHAEISKLLSENGIKYVFIKGVASASFYKQPDLRTMGDVDLLIRPCDIEKVNTLLYAVGYSTKDDLNKRQGHIGYFRNANGLNSSCEVHFNVKGIPDTLSEAFDRYFNNIFEAAREIKAANEKCLVPSEFHHGIILLLHTASHLTHEGIGLRHLCDWAVFVNSFSNEKFVEMFEKPLKEMGLWRFARLLTLCCEKFLGTDQKPWAEKAEESLLIYMLSDILNGGNFGFKNKDRYGQIKYISNRITRTVNQSNVFLKLFNNINSKAEIKYSFAKKHKILLPAAWLLVMLDYLFLVLSRKRRVDNINTIKDARQRQSIYSEFKLFEIE